MSDADPSIHAGIQIDKNVDSGHQNLGGNEDNDNPFEIFTWKSGQFRRFKSSPQGLVLALPCVCVS